MNQKRNLILRVLVSAFLITLFGSIHYTSAFAQQYWVSPFPFSSAYQLIDMSYSYDPGAKILTKSYTFRNVSGLTLQSPRLVNLFLWSNNICSANWATMNYAGTTFSNIDQSAQAASNGGVMDWWSDVTPHAMNSATIFPTLPSQSVQSGVTYPYWDIPGYPSGWPNGQDATVSIQFSNIENCNWIQNMVWIIYQQQEVPTLIKLSEFKAFPSDGAVTLMWVTESEIDTAGFNIYRSEMGSSEMVKINASLITAKGNATSGAEYEYTDTNVKNGVAYTYTLEDIDTHGVTTAHGPVRAVPRWFYALFHD